MFDGAGASISFPWTRYRNALAASEEEDYNFYQQRSPFFFQGETRNQRVFFKVWRIGDLNISEEEIKNEISFLRRARVKGVSVPHIFDKLTTKVSTATNLVFHVLGMSHAGSTSIIEKKWTTVLLYLFSLSQNVEKLHKEAGIIHCDIKPDNVAWVESTKNVKILDFGHAQMIEKTALVRGTKGLEAPELLQGVKNSCATDAYSVGATVEWQIQHCLPSSNDPETSDVSSVQSLVHEIVKGLLKSEPEFRMTLQAASMRLEGFISQQPFFAITGRKQGFRPALEQLAIK